MTGFVSPNHTQTPNDLFDCHMAQMGDAELRVVLVAIRKMLGYHKDRESISLTQFEDMSGLSRQGVIDGLAAAIKRGLIEELPQRGKRGVKTYGLVIQVDQSEDATSQASRPVTSQPTRPVDDLTSQASRHTKENKTKEKEKKKDAATPPKRIATPKKKDRKPNEAQPIHDALIEVFGLNGIPMINDADAPYWAAATKLHKATITADDIPLMYQFMDNFAKKRGWSGFTVNALPKYSADFLKWKAVQQRRKAEEDWENGTGKSFTPTPEQVKELDDILNVLDEKFSGKGGIKHDISA